MLGDQVCYIKKKKSDWEKEKTKRKEEREKNAFAQISLTNRSRFICGPIELKFGEEV